MAVSAELGQEKVGTPQMEAIEAVVEHTANKNWDDFNPTVAMYYLESMLANHLLRFIQNALGEDELKSLDPNKVRLVTLILWRDHFRQNAKYLRPKTGDDAWVDEVFDSILTGFGIDESSYGDFSNKFDLDDLQAPWAVQLSAPLGLKPHQVSLTHSTIVRGVEEDLLPRLKEQSKPWWKFW